MKALVLANEYQEYCSLHEFEYRIMPGAGFLNYASILMELDLTDYDACMIQRPQDTHLLLSNQKIEWKELHGKDNEKIYLYNRNNLLFTNKLDWALEKKFYNRTLAQYNIALQRNHWQLLEDVSNAREIPVIDKAGKLLCQELLREAGIPAIKLESKTND